MKYQLKISVKQIISSSLLGLNLHHVPQGTTCTSNFSLYLLPSFELKVRMKVSRKSINGMFVIQLTQSKWKVNLRQFLLYFPCTFGRLEEFKSGEDDWQGKLKKIKHTNVVQTSLADRYSQLQESENAWKKKVTTHHSKLLPLFPVSSRELT